MRLRSLVERARAVMPPQDGKNRHHVRPIPGLGVVGYARPTALEASIQTPAICLFLQGRKVSTFAGRTYELGPGDCWLVSHDMPVVARVEEAPSLAVLFDVDSSTLRGLYDELADVATERGEAHAFLAHQAEPVVVDALDRYLALADSSVEARVLGPMIAREIHYRLVMSPLGGMLRRLLRTDSHASAITRAIALIRHHFRAALVIPELARAVGMSPSLFYQQFKLLTSCTPLQFQKELRLHEARRLLGSGASVSAAAYDVGYESPNQFSREYRHKFGNPPSHDARS